MNLEGLRLSQAGLYAKSASVLTLAMGALLTTAIARADVVFAPTASDCGSGSPNGFSGATQTANLATFGGVRGTSLTGNCSAFFPASSGNGGLDLYASMSGGSEGSDIFSADSMRVAWLFTPDSDVFADIDWMVWVTINGLRSEFGGTALPGDQISGEGDVSVPLGGTLDSWEAGVGFSQAARIDVDSNLSLDLPTGSLDLNAPLTPVPEPAGVWLLATMLAFIGIRRLCAYGSAAHVGDCECFYRSKPRALHG